MVDYVLPGYHLTFCFLLEVILLCPQVCPQSRWWIMCFLAAISLPVPVPF